MTAFLLGMLAGLALAALGWLATSLVAAARRRRHTKRLANLSDWLTPHSSNHCVYVTTAQLGRRCIRLHSCDRWGPE